MPMLDAGCWLLMGADAGYWVLMGADGCRCWILGAGADAGYWVPLDAGHTFLA